MTMNTSNIGVKYLTSSGSSSYHAHASDEIMIKVEHKSVTKIAISSIDEALSKITN
jgi:hypothetical protein